MDGLNIVWSFSGAAARAIAHFRMAQAAIERSEKPTVIIGNSSGALAAPIIAVSYDDPKLLNDAIHFAETLDTRDMFPIKGNKPFNKKGKPTVGGVLRALSHNHMGWQDIKPLYKKVFTQEHFELLQRSDIKCIAFGVKGEDWTPTMYVLNDAKSLDDMIDMIETSSRIVPFVQPMKYNGEEHVDGGFISFQPAMWLFGTMDIKQLISFYSHEIKMGINSLNNWAKNVLTVATQAMNGMVNTLGYKDAIIEDLYTKLHNIQYLRVEAPDGYTDEIYETDDDQLIALGEASYIKAIGTFNRLKPLS